MYLEVYIVVLALQFVHLPDFVEKLYVLLVMLSSSFFTFLLPL